MKIKWSIRIILCYLILILCVGIMINVFKENNEENTSNLRVTVTLFPEYDFVKKIGKDKVSVDLLLNLRSSKPYI